MTQASDPTPDDVVAIAEQYLRAEGLVERLRAQWTARGDPVELVQTHISWVLLAATEAYKFKKPVSLGFLDFGTPAARRRACEEELRVNRRLAPQLYLDVVGFPVAPEHVACEYAVRMRRFAPDAAFDRRLALGRLTVEEVEAFARRIARFHRAADVAAPGQPWGRPQALAQTVDATLARLAATGAVCDDLRIWAAQAAADLSNYRQARLISGRVREGHGDLHLANAVVLDDGPTAFDAIEFDPSLRWIDVMTDFAFAVMDFIAHGRSDFAWRSLDAYLEESGDYESLAGLRYDLMYRAAIRALVARLRAPAAIETARTDLVPHAETYLNCARRCLNIGGPAALIVMRGWSGSGKSTVAGALIAAFGAVRARSDVERKRLHGLGAREGSTRRIPDGIYDAETTERTYARLREIAACGLAAGWRVILDAAHLRRDERQAVQALARAHGAAFLIIECHADPAVLQGRVQARQARGDDPSEADLAVLERQQQFDEPLDDTERDLALFIDTGAPLDAAALARRVLRRLDAASSD